MPKVLILGLDPNNRWTLPDSADLERVARSLREAIADKLFTEVQVVVSRVQATLTINGSQLAGFALIEVPEAEVRLQ